MRHALLLGPDHVRIGELALIGEGRAAIALCRGGAPKRYEHTDPNEDAAGFAVGRGGLLAAVADGHFGAGGAAVALRHVIEAAGPALTAHAPAARHPEGWCDALYAVLQGANHAILAADRGDDGPPVGRTTLSLALVRPGEDLLLHASVGDSHVFRIDAGGVADRGWQGLERARPHFLGSPEERENRANTALGCEPLGRARAIVLASDGLSETAIGVADPAGCVAACAAQSFAAEEEADRRAVALCRGVGQAAIDAQRRNDAGDNIAVAALLLGGSDGA